LYEHSGQIAEKSSPKDDGKGKEKDMTPVSGGSEEEEEEEEKEEEEGGVGGTGKETERGREKKNNKLGKHLQEEGDETILQVGVACCSV